MPRVVICDPAYPADRVRELLHGLPVTVEPYGTRAEGDDVVGLLVGDSDPICADDLAGLPGLKVIATGSTGYDHVPLQAAKRRGIRVCNVPSYCEGEMAETAVALIFALVRGVVELDRSVRSGTWAYDAAGPLRRVNNLRLGVVGFGRIGRETSRLARAVGMDVSATDPAVADDEIRRLGVRPMPLEPLLRTCDAISLHAPLTPATEHLIGRTELAMMKPGAVLVNVARGGLVDVAALVGALTDGRLGGAALDVLPVEPPDTEHPAPMAPGLIVTPHAAWYSPEARERALVESVLSVRSVLEDGVPRNEL